MRWAWLHIGLLIVLGINLVVLTAYPSEAQIPDSSKIPLSKEAQAKTLYDQAASLLDADTTDSWHSAAAKFEEARRLFAELGDRFRERDVVFLLGFVNNHLGLQYRKLHENEKAIEHYSRALSFYHAAADKIGEGDVLNNIGKLHEESGENGKALESYERTLQIFRENGDKRREARSLNNIGVVYSSLGEADKALEFLAAARLAANAANDKMAEARILSNVGLVYYDLKNYPKALEQFERAFAIQTKIDDKPGVATTLNNIGLAHSDMGEIPLALTAYENALAMDQAAGDKIGESRTLNNIGTVYRRQGRYQTALNYLNRALKIATAIGDKEGQATSLVNVGSVHDRDGSPRGSSLGYYNRALSLFEFTGNKRGQAIVFHNTMLVWEARKKRRIAILHGKQAVNIWQELRQAATRLDSETRDIYLASTEGTYRKLAELLILDGRFSEAQAVLDLLKYQEYKQLTRSGEPTDTIPYSKTESDVVAKIEGLVALERERNKLQALATRTKEQETKLEQLVIDIAAANKAFDASLLALGRAESSTSARVDEIRTGQEIQSALVALGKETGSGVVALYTVLGSKEKSANDRRNAGPMQQSGTQQRSNFGWVIMVTGRSYKAYPIDVTDIESNVFNFRSALSSDKYDPRPLAEKIYNAIFRQVSPKQKRTLETDLREYFGSRESKTIMWSLDGVLRYIPMAALHDGNRYLVENYSNLVFTRQSFLWLVRESRPGRHALGLGVSEGREEFAPLPGVEKELETIIREPNRTSGILEGSIILNGDFTRRALINNLGSGRYTVVHIASHYSFDPAQHDRSFLLIGDGRLTFTDLKENKNLFGDVDLVTLSACDTGVSGNGKEAEGFAYLAQSLGAKSVIASLWKVSDLGTPELMIRFYKLSAENSGLSKGEAFRRAQLSLLGSENKQVGPGARRSEIIKVKNRGPELPLFDKDPIRPFRHPHFWASFVLIGNWR